MSPDMAKKLSGGRRRKTAKKGGFYSFNGSLATGAPAWGRGSEMAPEVAGRAGNTTGGRRRKSAKKGGRKTRKTRRGGGSFAQAVAGFTGVGTARGLGGFQDVSSPAGKAAGGQFNDYGAKPGDFKSFK